MLNTDLIFHTPVPANKMELFGNNASYIHLSHDLVLELRRLSRMKSDSAYIVACLSNLVNKQVKITCTWKCKNQTMANSGAQSRSGSLRKT